MAGLLNALLRSLLPQPLLSLALLLAWLMLNESLSAGHVLLGTALALAIPWATARWRDKPRSPSTSTSKLRLRALRPVLQLFAVVLYDIVKSNIDVARRVLGPPSAIAPRFVWVPLALRSADATVLLAAIVTNTPGTVSAALSDDRRHLLVHALHCPDDAGAAAIVADIQTRYEAPLRAIFE